MGKRAVGEMEAKAIALQDGVASAWTKGLGYDGQRCLGDWVSVLRLEVGCEFSIRDVLNDFCNGHAFIPFNDAPATTHEDVLLFCDEVIEAAREWDEGWRW